MNTGILLVFVRFECGSAKGARHKGVGGMLLCKNFKIWYIRDAIFRIFFPGYCTHVLDSASVNQKN